MKTYDETRTAASRGDWDTARANLASVAKEELENWKDTAAAQRREVPTAFNEEWELCVWKELESRSW